MSEQEVSPHLLRGRKEGASGRGGGFLCSEALTQPVQSTLFFFFCPYLPGSFFCLSDLIWPRFLELGLFEVF